MRTTMASSLHRVELWSWFCGADLAPSAGAGSPCLPDAAALFVATPLVALPTTCLRQAIVTFTQLLPLFAFFLCVACFPSVLPGALSRSELRKVFEVGSILYNVTAVLSGVVALAFLTAASGALVAGDQLFPHAWLSLLVQGVAWLTIACSLRIRLRNPTKQNCFSSYRRGLFPVCFWRAPSTVRGGLWWKFLTLLRRPCSGMLCSSSTCLPRPWRRSEYP